MSQSAHHAAGRLGPDEIVNLAELFDRMLVLEPAEVAQRPYSAAEQDQAERLRSSALVGTAAQVADKLRALSDAMQVEELVLITWTHDPVARRRSYEWLAAQFPAG